MKPRTLVTGGAGFIGSHVVDLLLELGHEITVVFDRVKPGNLAHVEGRVEFVHRDIRDLDACIAAVSGVDTVIHLAALINVDHSLEDPSPFYDVNTQGTMNLLEAARRRGPALRKFVMMSTFEVYGQILDGRAVEDETFCDPRSPYAASKYAAERYCLSYAASYDSPEITVVRGANVYGPRQSAQAKGAAIAIFINKILHDKAPIIFGTGDQTRDYVFVKDTARGIVAAATILGIHGEIINLCSGRDVSMLEIVRKILHELGSELEVQFADPRPGENIRSCGDPRKAERLLDWYAKKPFSKGLKETIESYQGI